MVPNSKSTQFTLMIHIGRCCLSANTAERYNNRVNTYNTPIYTIWLRFKTSKVHMHRKLNALSRMQCDRRMAFILCRTSDAKLTILNCMRGELNFSLFTKFSTSFVFTSCPQFEAICDIIEPKTSFVLCCSQILCWERTWLSIYYIEMNTKSRLDDSKLYTLCTEYSVLNAGRSNVIIYTLRLKWLVS